MTTKTKKQSVRTTRTSTISLPPDMPIQKMESVRKPLGLPISKIGLIAIILGVVIVGLFAVNRGWVVAAIVNNKPIFRSNLNQALISRYGTQTLENMISEQLIGDEAKRQGVTVTQAEIDAQQQQILTSFGGNVTLDEVLQYQGMTKTEFDQQIKLQMLLTKLIGKDIMISDIDVTNYIATNAATLVATDSVGMQKEAKDAIMIQKVGEQLQTWYATLKEKAKIYKFIK